MNSGSKLAGKNLSRLLSLSSKLSRPFARQIKSKRAPIDIESLAINEQATIYRADIEADRDFFYQEMVDISDESAMLKFYEDRRSQIDGFGVKLLLIKLVQNKRQGALGKKKVFRNMVDSQEKAKYAVIEKLLDERTVGGLDELSNSDILELIEVASKYQLNSYQFTLLVIKKFLVEAKLQPSQWIYELLLRCVRQDSDAYPVILQMLETDLGLKRIKPDDITVVLSLLERTLAFGGENLILIKQLEFYLEKFAATKLKSKHALFILDSYSENGYRTPNLNVLDFVAASLIPTIKNKSLEELRDLLSKAVVIGFEHFSLLSAVSRRLFEILSEKAIQASISAPNFPEDLDLSQDELEDQNENEDAESLEAITEKLFGSRQLQAGLIEESGTDEHPKEGQDLLLGERIAFLPEILYCLVKLNVVSG